jgi:CHAT domain-containing protein/tetratricopeptide (TPR) repeat protein
MKFAILALGLAVLLGAQQPEPTPGEVRLAERLAVLDGNAERHRLMETEKPPITASLLRAIVLEGNKHRTQGDNNVARGLYELAFEYATAAGLEDQGAAVIGNLGQLSDAEGEYEKALDDYRQAIGLGRKIGNMVRVTQNLSDASITLRKLGNFEESVEAAQESITIAEAMSQKAYEGMARTSLAAVWKEMGNYREALEQDFKALRIAETIGSRQGQAVLLNNIGGLYVDQGNTMLALDYYRRSLRIKEELGNKALISSAYYNLASTLIKVGNYPLAAEHGARAAQLAEEAGDKPRLARALGVLADIDHRQGRIHQAVARQAGAVNLLDAIHDLISLDTSLTALGTYQSEAGQTAEGLASLSRAIAMSRDLGDRLILYQAASEAGRIYRTLNRLPEARSALAEAIATVESMRGDLSGGVETEQQFMADKAAPYHEMVLLAVADGKPDDAFRFAERGRTQALLDVLRNGRVSVTKALTDEERKQERQLRVRMAALNERLYVDRAEGSLDRSGTRRMEDQVRSLRLQQADFENRLYANHPQLRAQRLEVPSPLPAEIASLLPDRKTALLEYVVTENETLLFLIGKGMAAKPVLRIPVTRKALQASVDRFVKAISERSLSYRDGAREFHRLLIEPAAKALATRSALVIVADGPLWQLPFQALESAGGQTLLDRYSISYAPSATVLRELLGKTRTGPVRNVLALGNPPGANLPESESEVNALRDLYGAGNSQILVGAGATEAALKSQAGRYDVVHIASHGVIDDGNPLYSYISLGKTNTEDGLLEAREMLNLDLKAQLVILSACETARGTSGGGEGLIGMTWALFLGGSSATVASGWKVGSAATAQLMTELHRGLRQGLGKAAALRAASLALKNDARYSHPFYWAAFSLSGNGF